MRKFIKQSKNQELDSKECELFLNAFYQGEIPALTAPKQINDDQELFLQAIHSMPMPSKDKFHARVNKTTKKKKMVDAKIDLHGMYVEQAIMALAQFMQRELNKGSKKLLVVHGKGSGALRNAVWAFIESHGQVDDFQVAIGKMGGEGALLVRINQRIRK